MQKDSYNIIQIKQSTRQCYTNTQMIVIINRTTAIDKTSLVPKMQARKMIEFKIQSKMFSCINIYNIQLIIHNLLNV